MEDVTITDEQRARATELVVFGASSANDLMTASERDIGAADSVAIATGLIDGAACWLAAAAGHEAAADILKDIAGSLEERLREATGAAH